VVVTVTTSVWRRALHGEGFQSFNLHGMNA
jgi:hypothetical protein